MMLGVKNCVHRLKIDDLIMLLVAINVVDMETFRNRPAMSFPHSAMEKDRLLGVSVPRGIISV